MPTYGARGSTWKDSSGTTYYKVAKWDTLWTISQKFYGNGKDYTKIASMNSNIIKDPWWIYPNQVFIISKGTPVVKKNADPPKPKVPPTWPGGQFLEQRQTVDINKYEYSYGIRQIIANSIKYDRVNALVTKPLVVNENIREISIEVADTNPVFNSDDEASPLVSGTDASSIITNLEYYVSYGDDWIPILPMNINEIKNEYLFVNNSVAELRFKANTTFDCLNGTSMYKDGIKMSLDKHEWNFMSDKKRVIINNYDSSANYTIDYFPDMTDDPTKITIDDTELKKRLVYMSEVFSNGTDGDMKIVLANTPYIDYNVISASGFDTDKSKYPISMVITDSNFVDLNKNVINTIYMKDSSIEHQTISIDNVTDYANSEIPELQPFDAVTHPYIEFYNIGDELHFTETFSNSDNMDNIKYGSHGDGTITVGYYVPQISLRLKIIFRRTTDNYDEYTTPVCSSVILHTKKI